MAPTKRRRPSTLGTVRKLPSGRFQASYRIEGRHFTAPATFTHEAEALAWLARERADRAAGTWQATELDRLELAPWARSWLASRTDLAPSTRDLYRHYLERWVLPDLGGIDLAALTPARVRHWFAELAPRTEAAATRPATPTTPTRTGLHPARAWALAQGLDVKPTGKLPARILEAWQQAQRDAAAPAPVTGGPRPGATASANAYRVLRACLNAAVRDGLISANPCTVEGAGTVKHPERTPATPAEVAAMAEAMPAELRAAVLIAAWSGLRFGELFALTRKHVDLDAGSLRVAQSLSRARTLGPTKTASSVRTVYLPGFVTEALAAHMATHTRPGPGALIFTAATGAAVRQAHVLKHFRRAAHEVGRDDLHWHDLRHTGATLAYSVGGTIRDVQRRLGHATARAALIYAHAADDGDRRLADALEAAYGTGPATPPPATAPALRLVHAAGSAA